MVEPVSDRRAPADCGRVSKPSTQNQAIPPAKVRSGICECGIGLGWSYRRVYGIAFCWLCGRERSDVDRVSPAVQTEHGRALRAPGARPFFCAECGRYGICPNYRDVLVRVEEVAAAAANDVVPNTLNERNACPDSVNPVPAREGVSAPAMPESAADLVGSDFGEPWRIVGEEKHQGMVGVVDRNGDLVMEVFVWLNGATARMDALRRAVDAVNSAAGLGAEVEP